MFNFNKIRLYSYRQKTSSFLLVCFVVVGIFLQNCEKYILFGEWNWTVCQPQKSRNEGPVLSVIMPGSLHKKARSKGIIYMHVLKQNYTSFLTELSIIK